LLFLKLLELAGKKKGMGQNRRAETSGPDVFGWREEGGRGRALEGRRENSYSVHSSGDIQR